MENDEEKMFYDLKIPREKCYYYAINKKQLSSDGALIRKIRKQINDMKKEGENSSVSYGVYGTEYENNYVYVVANSTLIQEQSL